MGLLTKIQTWKTKGFVEKLFKLHGLWFRIKFPKVQLLFFGLLFVGSPFKSVIFSVNVFGWNDFSLYLIYFVVILF